MGVTAVFGYVYIIYYHRQEYRLLWGWIVSKVQSVFWRRVTSLRRGVVSTGGGTFLLEDTSFCGGVRFDLEEGGGLAHPE